MSGFGDRVNFIWGIADLIRDTFSRGKYKDVILPLTVLRRLDCVLEPTKQQVLAEEAKWQQLGLKERSGLLTRASGYAFYNISPFNFERLLGDADGLASNLRSYINSFSDNMREVLERFEFDSTLNKLAEAGLLFKVMERFKNVDLHPDHVSNHDMGMIFEELIRRFNEALNENPGEHFTPREVIELMVSLLLAGDEATLTSPSLIRSIYDPCCGTGGMLSIAKEHLLALNPGLTVNLFGQEVNAETFAVCKSDFYLKSEDGRDAEEIKYGSTLAHDAHPTMRFDYMLANPPYGKDWKRDEVEVKQEAAKGDVGRFPAGLPRISDGQLLFLQHMLTRMQRVEHGGARIAIVMNGSPLFTGDAGSGESEIRRWIIENDWLDAIVALPEQLFYNTGISTYIWLLSNRKPAARRGRVLLIDAGSYWAPMKKSLGDKRRYITPEQIDAIAALYRAGEPGERVRFFDRADLGYRRITVERPLRLNFQATPERLARLPQQRAFADLAQSRRKEPSLRELEEAAGREQQAAILAMLGRLPATLYHDRAAFERELDAAARAANVKLAAPLRKSILTALSEREDTARPCLDAKGHPEPDSDLRDAENVPLVEPIADYFAREVAPHLPDAWINTTVRDPKDGGVGRVGYEINFNRYFYQYRLPRPLAEIEADIKALEREIIDLLQGVAR